MGKITAPFTPEQVKKLQQWQNTLSFHPFTCCSHEGCERGEDKDGGVLVPSTEGWICPCGKYTQDWAHDFMADSTQDTKSIDTPIRHTSVHGKGCNGCIRHKRDVLVTMVLDPPEGSEKHSEFNDYFLTTDQASLLRDALSRVLDQNKDHGEDTNS